MNGPESRARPVNVVAFFGAASASECTEMGLAWIDGTHTVGRTELCLIKSVFRVMGHNTIDDILDGHSRI